MPFQQKGGPINPAPFGSSVERGLGNKSKPSTEYDPTAQIILFKPGKNLFRTKSGKVIRGGGGAIKEPATWKGPIEDVQDGFTRVRRFINKMADRAPGPGKYYSSSLGMTSSILSQTKYSKRPASSCFGSSIRDLKLNNAETTNPGPGEYEPPKSMFFESGEVPESKTPAPFWKNTKRFHDSRMPEPGLDTPAPVHYFTEEPFQWSKELQVPPQRHSYASVFKGDAPNGRLQLGQMGGNAKRTHLGPGAHSGWLSHNTLSTTMGKKNSTSSAFADSTMRFKTGFAGQPGKKLISKRDWRIQQAKHLQLIASIRDPSGGDKASFMNRKRITNRPATAAAAVRRITSKTASDKAAGAQRRPVRQGSAPARRHQVGGGAGKQARQAPTRSHSSAALVGKNSRKKDEDSDNGEQGQEEERLSRKAAGYVPLDVKVKGKERRGGEEDDDRPVTLPIRT